MAGEPKNKRAYPALPDKWSIVKNRGKDSSPTLRNNSGVDSIAASVFVDWLSLSNTESEANPNNNLMMRQAGLSIQLLTLDGRWWQLSCFLQVVAAAPILLTTLMVPVKVSTTSTQQGAIGRLLIWSIW